MPPTLILTYFLTLISSICKLSEAFQGCLHLWSARSGPHRKYQILKHESTQYCTLWDVARHKKAQRDVPNASPTPPMTFPRDTLSTSLNSLVFETRAHPKDLKQGWQLSIIPACQIMWQGDFRLLYLLISLRGWRDEEVIRQIIWGRIHRHAIKYPSVSLQHAGPALKVIYESFWEALRQRRDKIFYLSVSIWNLWGGMAALSETHKSQFLLQRIIFYRLFKIFLQSSIHLSWAGANLMGDCFKEIK